MAINLKKSLTTTPFALVFMAGALLIGSCKEPNPDKDTVCIKVPKDSSKLGQKNHFIPVNSIDIYKKDFKGTRDSLIRKYPDLEIPNSETFNKASIVEFFKMDQVVGLKFYYGIKPGDNKKKTLRLMIVGVDSLGRDVYLKNGSRLAADATGDEGGLEYGQCAPPCDN
jgi:hypothetical protein